MPRANRPTTYSGNYEWEGLVPIPRFCWETDTRLSIGARHGRLEALGGVYSKADCGSRWLLDFLSGERAWVEIPWNAAKDIVSRCHLLPVRHEPCNVAKKVMASSLGAKLRFIGTIEVAGFAVSVTPARSDAALGGSGDFRHEAVPLSGALGRLAFLYT